MNGWLLDTNVIAELASARPAASVAAWAAAQPEHRLYISVITLAEYDKGVENLEPDSPRRRRVERAVAALAARFASRVVSLDDATVRRWGRISGRVKRETGRAPPVIDTLLAAQAIGHDLCLVTRNVKDVSRAGARVFDPWREEAEE